MTMEERRRTIRRNMERVRLATRQGAVREDETLLRWSQASKKAIGKLKSRAGKSAARARQDWVIARVIEVAVFGRAEKENMSAYLGSRRPLCEKRVRELMDQAMLAVGEAADEAGLLERRVVPSRPVRPSPRARVARSEARKPAREAK